MKKKRRREGESPPPLTAEQQELVLRYARAAGCLALRCRRGSERLIDADEAQSAGHIALCRAAQQYDPSFGVNFWTFTKVAVKREVWTEIKNADHYTHDGLDACEDTRHPRTHQPDPDARRKLRELATRCADPAWAREVARILRTGRGQRLLLSSDRPPARRERRVVEVIEVEIRPMRKAG